LLSTGWFQERIQA